MAANVNIMTISSVAYIIMKKGFFFFSGRGIERVTLVAK